MTQASRRHPVGVESAATRSSPRVAGSSMPRSTGLAQGGEGACRSRRPGRRRTTCSTFRGPTVPMEMTLTARNGEESSIEQRRPLSLAARWFEPKIAQDTVDSAAWRKPGGERRKPASWTYFMAGDRHHAREVTAGRTRLRGLSVRHYLPHGTGYWPTPSNPGLQRLRRQRLRREAPEPSSPAGGETGT